MGIHISPLWGLSVEVWHFYRHFAPLGLPFGASEFIFPQLGWCGNFQKNQKFFENRSHPPQKLSKP